MVGMIRTDVSSGGASTSSSSTPSALRSDSRLLDTAYVRSTSALLKGAQMLLLLIGFICVKSSIWWRAYISAYNFFLVVTMSDFVMIFIFYIVYIFRVYRKLTCINWPLTEFLHYMIGTILLLIASIVTAARSYHISGLIAGATFGFLATILCILSIWLSYKVSCVTQSTDAAV